MNAPHRKIELQSPADLTYLTTLLRTTATSKLDLHLPPVTHASEPDDLRAAASQHLDAFISQIVTGLRQNISINGQDVMSGEAVYSVVEKEEFEPYDDALRQRLARLSERRDSLIAQVSGHRRGTPGLAARGFREGFEKEGERLELLRVESERVAGELRDSDVLSVGELKRGEEVLRNWERAVEGLGMLKGGLPETRARLERAGEVVGYLEGRGKAGK
ncbi:hypothetical protein CC78DRAFT_572728 [Lojkania enalia]|uniref:Uncharacterized protein n=1 Tax=Lojkania enalia TaxID=147567 RepID=A0A9P4N0W1_9PLEO|nr:hypothetical protein CC78DRAFT_572728 [Didymosphaeria enalia]